MDAVVDAEGGAVDGHAQSPCTFGGQSVVVEDCSYGWAEGLESDAFVLAVVLDGS